MRTFRIKFAEAIIVRRYAREMGYSFFINSVTVEEEVGIFEYVTCTIFENGVSRGFIMTLEELHQPIRI